MSKQKKIKDKLLSLALLVLDYKSLQEMIVLLLANSTIKRLCLQIPSIKKDTTSKNTSNKNIATILKSLPTLDNLYLPRVLLHADFLFYDIISIWGFAAVLDVICTSILCC